MDNLIPARQIAFGNPDGDGTLSSVPALTFDPAIGDLEMEMNSGAGQFNVLDPEEENGFSASASAGQTFVVGHDQVVLDVGTALLTEEVNLLRGVGIQLISHDANIEVRCDAGTLRLQALATGKIGFFDKTGIAKPSITGSRSSGDALLSLLAALADLGLATDNTTA